MHPDRSPSRLAWAPVPPLLRLPTGARSVPRTRWSAAGSRWRARPSTLAVLAVGLWLFGTGEAALLDAGIGNSPWTVFSEGLGEQLGISVGAATFVTSIALLLVWPLLSERPGLGTLANAVVIAVAIDAMRPLLPDPDALGPELAQTVAGIALVGIGSGLYLTCELGPGPRDGLMTGLHRLTGASVARVRLGIEVVVVAAGWALGGTVGAGTVLFAVLVGYSVALGLALADRSSATASDGALRTTEVDG